MTEQEVFVLADRTLNDVVAKISDDQRDMRMPASFALRGAGQPPTLREIVNYHGEAPLQDRLLGLTGRDPYGA
jgi:hypothetical protein